MKGKVIVKDGVVTVSEAGMKALGGTLLVNAIYDTRDTLRPVVRCRPAHQPGESSRKRLIHSIRFKCSLRQLQDWAAMFPSALKYKSLLGSNMMPVISTITGGGEMQSESVQILESRTFDLMKNVLKLNQAYDQHSKGYQRNFCHK